jgi:hypothetical protein
MSNTHSLGIAVLAIVLSTLTFAGASTAIEQTNDDTWQVAPGSLGAGAVLAREWIHPSVSESP